MAQRISTHKVLSDEVQGEGSYVVLRALPYSMISERSKVDQDDFAQVLAFNETFLASVVVDWNWVNDAGEALPLPSADPGVVNQLVIPEFQFIANAAGLDSSAKKD
jgi:hypothetical protein